MDGVDIPRVIEVEGPLSQERLAEEDFRTKRIVEPLLRDTVGRGGEIL